MKKESKAAYVIYIIFTILGILHCIYMFILPFTIEATIGKRILSLLLTLCLGAPITIGLYTSIGILVGKLIDSIIERIRR